MSSKIAFGTDGIRGNAEKYPFTDDGLYLFGQAIAKWAIEKFKTNSPTLLIGTDTRISCERIKSSLKKGLMVFPVNIVDAGVIPTPAICQLAHLDEKFKFGIVISASHNPFYDNGVKLFNAKTCKLSREDEEAIIKLFEQFSSTTTEQQPAANATDSHWPEAENTYKQNIKSHFKPNFLKGMKIVLDCANGATYKIAPEIFEHFGAEVVTIANTPTGKNINDGCGALHPEKLAAAVKAHNALAGFAFDGDGDRLVSVSKFGEIKTGDDILAILMQLPQYKNTPTIIGTIMSNQGLEDFLKNQNKQFIRTNVGDKYVTAKLESENLFLGGEPSGHVIMRDYLSTGDGIFNALRVAESIILNQNWEMTSFKKFPQVLINVPVATKKDLSIDPFASAIKQHEAQMPNGRILVRFSGTENLLRVMTEAQDMQVAQNVAQSLANRLKDLLDV